MSHTIGDQFTAEAFTAARQTIRDQAEEIEQLRTELASANERAQGPAERATAAIQLAEAFRNWAWREAVEEAFPPSLNLRDALALWETVR